MTKTKRTALPVLVLSLLVSVILCSCVSGGQISKSASDHVWLLTSRTPYLPDGERQDGLVIAYDEHGNVISMKSDFHRVVRNFDGTVASDDSIVDVYSYEWTDLHANVTLKETVNDAVSKDENRDSFEIDLSLNQAGLLERMSARDHSEAFFSYREDGSIERYVSPWGDYYDFDASGLPISMDADEPYYADFIPLYSGEDNVLAGGSRTGVDYTPDGDFPYSYDVQFDRDGDGNIVRMSTISGSDTGGFVEYTYTRIDDPSPFARALSQMQLIDIVGFGTGSISTFLAPEE